MNNYKLYTTRNCVVCERVKKLIKSQQLNIEVFLWYKRSRRKWYNKIQGNEYKKFPDFANKWKWIYLWLECGEPHCNAHRRFKNKIK